MSFLSIAWRYYLIGKFRLVAVWRCRFIFRNKAICWFNFLYALTTSAFCFSILFLLTWIFSKFLLLFWTCYFCDAYLSLRAFFAFSIYSFSFYDLLEICLCSCSYSNFSSLISSSLVCSLENWVFKFSSSFWSVARLLWISSFLSVSLLTSVIHFRLSSEIFFPLLSNYFLSSDLILSAVSASAKFFYSRSNFSWFFCSLVLLP